MAKPMTCASKIRITFSGIVFDGTKYGFTGDVNQSFDLPNLKPKPPAKPPPCTYIKIAAATIDNPDVGISLKLNDWGGKNRVSYALSYLFDGGQSQGTIEILAGESASMTIPNITGTGIGGTAVVQIL